jgi:hypothetical protein
VFPFPSPGVRWEEGQWRTANMWLSEGLSILTQDRPNFPLVRKGLEAQFNIKHSQLTDFIAV